MLAFLSQAAGVITGAVAVINAELQDTTTYLTPFALLAVLLGWFVQALVSCAILLSIASTGQDEQRPWAEVCWSQENVTVLSLVGDEDGYRIEIEILQEYLATISLCGEEDGDLRQGELAIQHENVYCVGTICDGDGGGSPPGNNRNENYGKDMEKGNDNSSLVRFYNGTNTQTDLLVEMTSILRWRFLDDIRYFRQTPDWGMPSVALRRLRQGRGTTDAEGGSLMESRGAAPAASTAGLRNRMEAHGGLVLHLRLTNSLDILCIAGHGEQRVELHCTSRIRGLGMGA